MKKRKRVGLYGGTFSPVHNGHVEAALRFADQYELDKLYIIPASVPPHKNIYPFVSENARFNMLHLAFSSNPLYNNTIIVSDYEFNAPKPSYSYNTVKHFMQTENADIFFLCGTDMLLSLDQWYKADELLLMCNFVFMRRSDSDLSQNSEIIRDKIQLLTERYGASISELKGNIIDISSSEIRTMLKNREDVSDYLPQEVIDYINNNHLYRS